MRQKNEELDNCGNELDVTRTSNAEALDNATKNKQNIHIAAVEEAVVNKMQKLRLAESEEKKNSLTLLENKRQKWSTALSEEKQLLLNMLVKEKQNSLIDLERESAASRFVLDYMEKRLNKSISRERQYQNDAIEFSKTKLTKKANSVKHHHYLKYHLS